MATAVIGARCRSFFDISNRLWCRFDVQVHPSNLTVYRLHVNLNRTKINIESNIITSTYILKHRYIYTGSPLCIVESDKITGKISETNKVRVMVIPIVAMLAVTMIVAGYRYEGEPIEVVEGYQTLEVEYRENLVEETDLTDKYYENETATAVTTVNNESTLELNVEMFMSSITGPGNYQTKIWLSAEGEFSDDLDPDEIRLTAQGLEGKNIAENTLDFNTGWNEADNASFLGWDQTEI